MLVRLWPGESMRVQVIVTAPPYAPFLDEVARHELVCGLRLSSVMPLKDGRDQVLGRLAALGRLTATDRAYLEVMGRVG
jgi:hypothetical protein